MLRRRWDDPGLHREGDHPVVFPGAGAHSGAFSPLTTSCPSRWRRSGASSTACGARCGQGPRPRPGSRSHSWTTPEATGLPSALATTVCGPELIDDETAWVRGFRRLWELDTRDAFGGERAP